MYVRNQPQASLGVVMSLAGLLLAAILHGNILSFLGAGIQYWVFQPVYLNMLQVYAFANTDDISWGALTTCCCMRQTDTPMHPLRRYQKPGECQSGPRSGQGPGA